MRTRFEHGHAASCQNGHTNPTPTGAYTADDRSKFSGGTGIEVQNEDLFVSSDVNKGPDFDITGYFFPLINAGPADLLLMNLNWWQPLYDYSEEILYYERYVYHPEFL